MLCPACLEEISGDRCPACGVHVAGGIAVPRSAPPFRKKATLADVIVRAGMGVCFLVVAVMIYTALF